CGTSEQSTVARNDEVPLVAEPCVGRRNLSEDATGRRIVQGDDATHVARCGQPGPVRGKFLVLSHLAHVFGGSEYAAGGRFKQPPPIEGRSGAWAGGRTRENTRRLATGGLSGCTHPPVAAKPAAAAPESSTTRPRCRRGATAPASVGRLG